MNESVSNVAMVTVYWLLTIFWVLVVGLAVAYLTWRPLFHAAPQPKRIMRGFLWLAIIFLLHSLYWSLANTSRVGLLSPSISMLLYKSWLIIPIKTAFLVAGIIYWITVVRTYRQIEQRVETLYFTRFADHTVDAIGVLSSQGIVVYWNQGAEQLYGQPRTRVIGKHIKEFLVPPRLHKSLDEILEKIRYSEQPDRFIVPRLKYDRTEILVDVTISPIIHDNGDFGGYFGIMRPAMKSEPDQQFENPRIISEVTSGLDFSPNTGELVRQMAEVVASEEQKFEKNQKIAGAIALALLIITCILLILTLLSDEPHKYFFGSGSILATFGEIWPLRFLVKGRGDSFRARAIQRVLDLPGMNNERLKIALEMVDAVGQRLAPCSAYVAIDHQKKN